MKRATLEKNPADVSQMFDEVAGHYDITNTVLTGGMVHVWRTLTREAVVARPGVKVLDLAAGTGTSANSYAQAGADVVACDFSIGMMREGKKRYPHLDFVAGDATALPFADDTFDVTTISYGLRNVVDTRKALEEMLRVTKPGGSVVIAEFSRPTNDAFRGLYYFFLRRVMPILSALVSSDAAAYSYLMESIVDWPDQKALAALMYEAGWERVEYKNLTNGIVALHRATKPL